MIVKRSDTSFLFAWTAFVLLPFNLIAGSLLTALSPSDFRISLIVGLGLTMFFGLPAVIIAQTRDWTYPEAAYAILPKIVAIPLVWLVPAVSLGWFTLQTAAAAHAISAVTGGLLPIAYVGVPVALLFVAGPLLFGFRWLSRTGAVACLGAAAVVAWLVFTTDQMPANSVSHPHAAAKNGLEAVLLILGTWVFSSTTCVMDLARFAKSRPGAVLAFVIGLLVGNGALITLGYALSRTDSTREMLDIFLSGAQLPGFVFLFASLWSTNDSNAYSTMQVLRRVGAPVRPLMLLYALIGGSVAAAFSGRLLNDALGVWLQAMGWTGVAIGLMWWIVLLKRPGSREAVAHTRDGVDATG